MIDDPTEASFQRGIASVHSSKKDQSKFLVGEPSAARGREVDGFLRAGRVSAGYCTTMNLCAQFISQFTNPETRSYCTVASVYLASNLLRSFHAREHPIFGNQTIPLEDLWVNVSGFQSRLLGILGTEENTRDTFEVQQYLAMTPTEFPGLQTGDIEQPGPYESGTLVDLLTRWLDVSRRRLQPIALIITIQPETLAVVIQPDGALFAELGLEGCTDPFWVVDTHGRAAISAGMGFMATCPTPRETAQFIMQCIIPYGDMLPAPL
ncbi:hypothetical protein PAPYR_3353 [Paratrimastix pyriformis]|uniref:Uncharacterized protein n=1 Tax=Paratrimastix pyriformis TaxID=342808 RepID=A0ABQ8UPG3_9EUKA|nr:hypothetical protein PAPYR_3353 [Paratrimastix pyriformis]